jgi:protein-glutamine gamma-glutamyltransferase
MGVQFERALPTPAQPADRIERFFQASLLGLLASGFLALAFSGYLDSATVGLTTLGLLARAVAVFGNFQDGRFSTPVANALTLAYIGFYPVDYIYLSREFIPATVHLVCFLSVVRILSARTNRDYFFVKVLAFLELLGATLLSSNISFFVFLTMFLIFGVATFCCSEIRRSCQQPRRIAMPRVNFHVRLAAITASITLGIVLMTAGLFVLLPRTARAAIRSFVPGKYHITGFANEVSLGQLGQIQQSSAPMLHVLIDGVHKHLPLKWRGGALSRFDGKRWYNPVGQNQTIRVDHGLAVLADEDQRRRVGQRITYQVRIDSVEADALFFAGVPEFIQTSLPLLFRTPQGAFRTGRGFGGASQYAATSFRPETETKPFLVAALPVDAANEYLMLPAMDQRIIDLARSLNRGGATPDRARIFEKYLRTNYSYTTELLKHDVPDPLANFLFERRAGHCEYFASAMAVMLRAVHIPSRVVTGFQSGVYNPMTGWHVLRASDAHSWVEAWAPGHGWMTFDPTPPANSPQGKPWSAMALYLDAADMWWQRWVMDYDLDHQLYLASRFEQSTRNWKGISADGWIKGLALKTLGFIDRAKDFVLTIGVVIILGVLLWSFLPSLVDAIRRRYHLRRIRQVGAGASDAALLYLRMLAILRKRGYEKPGWLTPAEFARVLPESRTAGLVREFTSLYQQLRYGNTSGPGERMLVLLDELGDRRR